jgi:nicotinamidase-related amidase
MATVRAGNKSALVVVDVQVGVVKDVWQAPRVIGNVAHAVQRARAAQVPVLWVQHVSEEMPAGSVAWQWVPELVPDADETRIHKRFESSFEETMLEQELAQRGVNRIVLAGAMTNWCIRATAYAALERGYDLTLLNDAHTTASMALEDGGKVEAEQVVQDLNIAMTWLNYPGRTCSTAAAAAVAFAGA